MNVKLYFPIHILLLGILSMCAYIVFDKGIILAITISIIVVYSILLSIYYVNNEQINRSYQKCLEISSIVCMFDKNNIFSFANPDFLKLVNMEIDQLVGVKSREFLKEFTKDPDYFDIVFGHQDKKVPWSGVIYFSHPYNKQPMEYTITSLSIVPVVDFMGRLKKSIYLMVPETTLDRAITELRNDSAITSNIDQLVSITIEKSPELFMIISNDHTVQYSNWSHLSDINESIRNSYPKCFSILKYADHPCDFCPAREVFRTGEIQYSETAALKRGKVFDVISYPIKNEQGDVIFAVQQCKDITDKVLMEVKIAKNMNELIQAKQDAETISRSKSAFLANISHEFTPLLHEIVGFASLLKSADLKNEYKEYVNVIEKNSFELSGIISDILDYSWLDNSYGYLSEDTFETTLLFFGITKQFEPTISEKKVIFIQNFDKNIPKMLKGNLTGIKRVLHNLLDNAIKFNKIEGSITISTKLADIDDTQCHIYFEIADTGVGISKKLQEAINNPFLQDEGKITNRRAPGVGMGLTIVHKYLNLMNSSLHIESEEGTGSKFSFTLTLKLPS